MNTTSVDNKKMSKKALEKKIDDAFKLVQSGGIYAHYKNPDEHYAILGVSLDVNTLEPVVMYGELSGVEVVWTRPLAQWLEKVEVDGKLVDRFTLIGEMSDEEEDYDDEEECEKDCNGKDCK